MLWEDYKEVMETRKHLVNREREGVRGPLDGLVGSGEGMFLGLGKVCGLDNAMKDNENNKQKKDEKFKVSIRK